MELRYQPENDTHAVFAEDGQRLSRDLLGEDEVDDAIRYINDELWEVERGYRLDLAEFGRITEARQPRKYF